MPGYCRPSTTACNERSKVSMLRDTSDLIAAMRLVAVSVARSQVAVRACIKTFAQSAQKPTRITKTGPTVRNVACPNVLPLLSLNGMFDPSMVKVTAVPAELALIAGTGAFSGSQGIKGWMQIFLISTMELPAPLSRAAAQCRTIPG